MGTKPDTDDYEVGETCDTCNFVIFDDATPKYVEASFLGITSCPGNPKLPPNGFFRLTQRENPCIWFYQCEFIVVTWQLLPDRSILTIHEGLSIWFASEIFTTCMTFFNNTTNCARPGDIGSGGTGKVYWGPAIDKPSTDPGYDVGDKCATCNATLFNCFTPKHVWAFVAGIVRCPFWPPDPPPSGTFFLQQIAPCVWEHFGDQWWMEWRLGPASSRFCILDLAGHEWFLREYPLTCITLFAGQGKPHCLALDVQATLGFVKVKWGPPISKTE